VLVYYFLSFYCKPVMERDESFLSFPLSVTHIMGVIPHRYPFLFLDSILEYEPGKRIKALKNVTMNEPYFQGHFPGLPIMPGVLQIEAMAQAGAYLVKDLVEDSDSKIAVLSGVDNFRFRRMVKPGDQLIMEGELLRFRNPVGKAHCRGTVNGELAVEGDILFSVVEKTVLLAAAR
jgi:3-hydroxyacyl-[acyl-carrier-protein] dehydratase